MLIVMVMMGLSLSLMMIMMVMLDCEVWHLVKRFLPGMEARQETSVLPLLEKAKILLNCKTMIIIRAKILDGGIGCYTWSLKELPAKR